MNPINLEEIDDIHALYHGFCKKFQKSVKHLLPEDRWIKIGKKTIKYRYELKWKWKGYELMDRVEEWAKKHPEVTIAHVDDDYFAGSDVVFIPHKSEKKFMGTTVLYIPQLTGEDPISFFMYPGHARSMLRGIENAIKMAEEKR